MKFYLSIRNISLQDGKSRLSLVLALTLVLNLFLGVFAQSAHAAALTEASIRFDRLGAAAAFNTTTGYKVLVVAKAATAGTETTVKLTFQDSTNTGFTMSATAADYGISTTGITSISYQGETLAAWPSIATATTVTDNGTTTDVTFPSGDLVVGTLYGFYIACTATTCITNPINGDAGQKSIVITSQATGPATVDSSTVIVDTVGTNADQVTVTASVDSSFNLSIPDISLPHGTLSTSAVDVEAMTTGIDIDTNANNGYVAWIRSEGAAVTLASASTGDAISSTDTSACVTIATTGTVEGNVVDVNATAGTNGTGTLTVATEYDCTDNTSGGVIATSYEQFVQRTGGVDSDTFVLVSNVKASTTNEPATDYTDTWEIVGAGNF